jgi:hypothetical protein
MQNWETAHDQIDSNLRSDTMVGVYFTVSSNTAVSGQGREILVSHITKKVKIEF